MNNRTGIEAMMIAFGVFAGGFLFGWVVEVADKYYYHFTGSLFPAAGFNMWMPFVHLFD